MKCHVFILMVGAICGSGAALARNPAPDPAPVWTWQFNAGVEWAERVGVEKSPRLLLCSRDARLHLIDLETGQDRLSQPIVAGPGVRLAEHSPTRVEEVIYCFDRYSVYALEIGASGKLRWRAGDPPKPPPDAAQGDPEFLRKILLARAVPAGVIVARDDGRVALLDRADGRTRWTLELPPLANVQLHEIGDNGAVLLWQSRGRFAARFFDLETGRFDAAAPPRLPETWPLWSAESAAGVVLAWADKVIVARPGAQREIRWPSGQTVLSATLALYPRAAGASGLAFLDTACCWRAYDLTTGVETWSGGDDPKPTEPWSALSVRGGRLWAWNRSAFVIKDVETGATLASGLGRAGQSLQSLELSGDFVWIVVSQEGPAGRQLWLNRLRVSPASAKDGMAFAPLSLGSADGLRRIVWSPGHVVVVAQNGVRAYSTP